MARGKKPARYDSAVMFAVARLRALGRELQSGSWSRSAAPTSVPQVLAVMAQALSFVVDAGIGATVERAKQTAADLFGVEELDFDDEERR